MDEMAIFTITKDGILYNIKSKQFNVYNRIGVTRYELFNEMDFLTDVFNNSLKIGIAFVIE